jgi:CelD/BcsL family acetyltransferase involved in cellulose biosynthesis
MLSDATNPFDGGERPIRLVRARDAAAPSFAPDLQGAGEAPPRWDVRLQVLRGLDVPDASLAAWDELAERTGASISMTPAWCRVWRDEYGSTTETRLHLLWRGDALLAAIPFVIGEVRLGPLKLRLARLMGVEENPHACVPAIADEVAPAMLGKTLSTLFSDEGCDAVRLGSLAGGGRLAGLAQSAADFRLCDGRIIEDRSVGAQAVLELPRTFDEYLASLSKNMRSTIRKGVRRLEAEHDLREILVANPIDAIGAYHRFVELHREQWTGEGRRGHFDDWPGSEMFNRARVASLSQHRRVWMHELIADQQSIARQYAFVHGRSAHCRLAARDPHERWRRHSVGAVSLALLIRRFIEAGVREVDLGTGRYEYKERLGATCRPVRSLLIARDQPATVRRARRFNAAARGFDWLYYRQWYCRVRPRLRLRGAPLRWSWIRSRP